jgi:phytanoyl-CoA hydroxylase
MADFSSRFKGFWTDTPDADKHVYKLLNAGEITAKEAIDLRQFIKQGYVILPNAISTELADQIADEMQSVHKHSEKFVARTDRQGYNLATEDVLQMPGVRILDYYVNSSLARQAIFSPTIARFLHLVFNRGIMAFQSLTFNVGSQQYMHQDAAYVVLSEPIQFAASWIALQDVEEGTGELQYYPGSHRFPDYLFSGEFKHWLPARDGRDQHIECLLGLNEEAERRGIKAESFLPKKGDALIWAGDLAHGGTKITKPDATRRSLVTHYCPEDVVPYYATYTKFFYKKPADVKNCFYSARHYDLRPVMDKRGETLRSPAGEILRTIERLKTEAADPAQSTY